MPFTATIPLEVPSLEDVAGLDDPSLIDTTKRWAEVRRIVDAGLATLAGEVAARSTLELGYDGLAQRAGLRTADALVSKLTGTSGTEARSITAVGTLLASPEPWLAEVAGRVSAGQLSVGAAAAIQTGLGAPSPTVAADDLADAAHALLTESGDLPPEKVARRARELRDELDEAGVADREASLREKRFLRLIPQGDGMTRLIGLLDPESAALVSDAVDVVTSPRRGGPRFVDPHAAARAEAIVRDSRSTEQLTLDALVEMVRIAAATDPGRVFGTRQPSVRVHVALADLHRGDGSAHLEGQRVGVSVQTAERLGCSDGLLGIVFDADGAALRHGRRKRLFTDQQRDALASIWGGCAAPECDRPPSWTEAHHINEWKKDGGSTDVEDGILLCRHHHLLVHNNGWRVRRNGTTYSLEPPRGDALNREAVTLMPKNPVHRRGRARAAMVQAAASS
ncbi:HNH endonuclease signature motif containing protein [soil metagenome]